LERATTVSLKGEGRKRFSGENKIRRSILAPYGRVPGNYVKRGGNRMLSTVPNKKVKKKPRLWKLLGRRVVFSDSEVRRSVRSLYTLWEGEGENKHGVFGPAIWRASQKKKKAV